MSTSTAALARAAIGSATIINHCPRPVYYHVSGFKNGRGWDGETREIPAEGFTMAYDTTVSIKLFHDPTQLKGSISQLEFNLDLAVGRVWYDISNVDAFRTGTPPFMEGGMRLTTHGEKHGNCMPIDCQKGERICKDAYNLWDDDMTFVCPQATSLRLVLCPDEHGPSTPPDVAPPQPPQGGRPGRAGTSKLVKVRDASEDEKLPKKPDAAAIGDLTWRNASNSKTRATKLPVLCLVASVACYVIALL